MKKLLIGAPLALVLVVVLLIAGLTTGVIGPTNPSDEAAGDIPSSYLGLYAAAADTCPGLSWTVLAAVGKIETDHGRLDAPGVTSGANFAGAAGPMQFGIGGKAGNTWGAYGLDGDQPPDGIADVYNPADAIFTAARYLCVNGARGGKDMRSALFAYNRANWYVNKVLAQADRYASAPVLAVGRADASALLNNPKLGLTESARYDLEQGVVDARVIGLLEVLLQSYSIKVSVFKTGHSTYVKGSNRVSNHTLGRAVDIYEINGERVSSSSASARAVVAWLATGEGPLRPTELGSPFGEFTDLPGVFTDSGHQGHIHVAWGE